MEWEVFTCMDTSVLEDIGLTPAEIKVYTALLELGSSTAGNILEKSGIQNSVVHRALHSLIEKGIINYNLEGKRRNYQATAPEHFYNFIDEKKKRFEQLLPELKEKQKRAGKKEIATVYKGIRGIKEIYSTMINTKGKEYLTFGGGKPCEELLGTTWWLNIHAKRIEKKLPSRQVFDETVRTLGRELNKKKMTRIKFLSKKFEQLQETVIVGDCVAINVFTENPYGFLIQDNVVADGYRKQFEILWKEAKQ